jgi:hypothetical protein
MNKNRLILTFCALLSLVFTGCPPRQQLYMDFHDHEYNYNAIKGKNIAYLAPILKSLEDLDVEKDLEPALETGIEYYENETFTFMEQFIEEKQLNWNEIKVKMQAPFKNYIQELGNDLITLPDSLHAIVSSLGAEFLVVIYDVNYIEGTHQKIHVESAMGIGWVRGQRVHSGHAVSMKGIVLDVGQNRSIVNLSLKNGRVYDPQAKGKKGKTFKYECSIPGIMQLFTYTGAAR